MMATEKKSFNLASRWQRIHFLGVGVHKVTQDEALEGIECAIEARVPCQVITADASGVVMAQKDAELKELYNNADLVTPDSAGILWAAKRYGTPLNGRVSGVDLVYHLCRLSHEKSYKLFFFGAAPGVTDQAASNFRDKFPNIQVVGTRNGYFKPEEEPEIIVQIKETKPDVLFVALGIPKQEKWIAKYKNELNVPVLMGVGGSFDVFAGLVKRAPLWMQKINCEWLWRLIQNPRKIGKVLTLPRFVLMVLTRR